MLTPGRQTVPLSELHEWPDNPRQIDAVGLEQVIASLKAEPELLEARPLIALPDGTVIAGNARLKALRAMEVKQATAHVIDADEDRAREIALRDNNHPGDWLASKLAPMLAGLQERGSDLMGLGFRGEEVDGLLASLRPKGEVPVTEAPEEPVTQPGDLIVLGEHRLVCGDATDGDLYARLLEGEAIDLVWTDPPYGVDIEGVSEARGGRTFGDMANDGTDVDALEAFLATVFSHLAAVAKPGAPFYSCFATATGDAFRSAIAAAGWSHRQELVWIKNSLVLGRADYQWRHEPILYGWKPGAKHYWQGGRKRDTVLESIGDVDSMSADECRGALRRLLEATPGTVIRVGAPKVAEDHPTVKPQDLIRPHLLASSPPGGLVIDPFGGSGSTLLACEAEGRRARMLELSPAYCDLIVARWESMTGQKAQR